MPHDSLSHKDMGQMIDSLWNKAQGTRHMGRSMDRWIDGSMDRLVD